MAFDPHLAARLRDCLASEPAVREKRMFGGVAFLVDGALAVCASHDGGLLVRIDPAESGALCAEQGVEPMIMQGRPMKGWLRVDASACEGDRLGEWVRHGVTFVKANGV